MFHSIQPTPLRPSAVRKIGKSAGEVRDPTIGTDEQVRRHFATPHEMWNDTVPDYDVRHGWVKMSL
jgi:hypothetical protein